MLQTHHVLALAASCGWLLVSSGSAMLQQSERGAAPQIRTVDRSECLPMDELPGELRAKSEALLLDLLDGEGLYTFVGGLKPVTTRNLYKLRFRDSMPTTATPEFLQAAEEMRRLVSPWRCGGVMSYTVVDPQRIRLGDTIVIHQDSVRRTIRDHANHFLAWGLTPSAHPVEVATVLSDKWEDVRGIGYLIGYPDYAVEWFAESRPKLARGDVASVEIPTFTKRQYPATPEPIAQFGWSVPKGHQENDADRRIKARAAQILAAYRERREKYIGAGKPGAFALLRDWYCDGNGRCSVEHARFGESQ